MNYFRINVKGTEQGKDDYSIFLSTSLSIDDAVAEAVRLDLFTNDGDDALVENVIPISEKEYQNSFEENEDEEGDGRRRVSTVDFKENVIEWLNGDDYMGVTLHQKKFINRVEKLAKQYPEDVQVLARNEDGSIFAHLSLRCLHLFINNSNASGGNAEHLAAYRKKKNAEEVEEEEEIEEED